MSSFGELLKSTPGMIRDAATSYLKPVGSIRYIAGKCDLPAVIAKEETRIPSAQSVVANLSQMICYNQGAFVQYSFVAAEKHKLIKDEFRKGGTIDNEKILALMKDLINFLNSGLFVHTYNNLKYLKTFFESRHEIAPRFCIKGNFKLHNMNMVVSVFRDKMVNYSSDCHIETNTGFHHIFKTGKYYINNDLPESTLRGEYHNPRFKLDKVKRWRSLNADPSCNLTTEGYVNDVWKELWKDCERSDDPFSFYKSTLIIPMTLWNNDLSDGFKDLINIRNVDRVIFGFLCMDHVSTGFFDEEFDVPIGYIFADILSQYLITRLVYTEISETFRNVEAFLEHGFPENMFEKIDITWKKLSDISVSSCDLPVKIKESENNKLYPLDSSLIKYVAATPHAE